MKKLKNLDISFSLSLGQIITILIGIVWGIIYIVGVLEYGFWGGSPGSVLPLLGAITLITTIALIFSSIVTTVIYIVVNWNKNIINFKIKKE